MSDSRAATYPRDSAVEIEFTVLVGGNIVAAFGDRQSAGRAQGIIRAAIRAGEPIPALNGDGRRA
jgi:hypothetical protein